MEKIKANKNQVDAYLQYVGTHVDYVMMAGTFIGVGQGRLVDHDQSKFSAEEMGTNAVYYFMRNGELYGSGDQRPQEIIDAYAYAWLHHIHANDHHWQHWIFPQGFVPRGSSNVINGVMEMSKDAALEMVADWMGASKAYTGSWDMTNWLESSVPRITLHPETADYVSGVLSGIGYRRLMKTLEFRYP